MRLKKFCASRLATFNPNAEILAFTSNDWRRENISRDRNL